MKFKPFTLFICMIMLGQAITPVRVFASENEPSDTQVQPETPATEPTKPAVPEESVVVTEASEESQAPSTKEDTSTTATSSTSTTNTEISITTSKEESTTTTVKKQMTTREVEYHPAPIGNNPINYQVVTTTVASTSSVQNRVEQEKIELMKGEFVAFNANVFQSEKEADKFIQMIQLDPETKDIFKAEKKKVKDDFILVLVTYTDKAKAEEKLDRYILLYIASSFDDQKKAEDYLKEKMLIYPDLFVAGEIVEVENKYNIVFGIRPNTDPKLLTYDEKNFDVQYDGKRKEYKYKVKINKDTMKFEDPIPEAVEAAFPGKFTFTSHALSSEEEEVTMTPVNGPDNQSTEDTTTIGQ